MATVYLADDLKHERKVALKVLKPELAAVVGAERFLAEIKTTANLQHPHILPLFDSGEADSFLFYAMPHVEGESLRQRIDRDKQLPVDEAVQITTAVAKALQHAHDRGVIHRDIKPANILMQDGQPVVSDFGIALAVGAAGGSRLTETGLSVGTPFYMSPEQATGDQQVGPPSDTYALAAVLYEMLTGEPPYMGTTAQAVLGKIIQGAPVSVTQIRKSVPSNVGAAIRRALEKLPADRFTGAQEFARALADRGFRHGEEAAAAVGAARGQWTPLAMVTSALGLVLFVALGWALLRPEPPQPMSRQVLSTEGWAGLAAVQFGLYGAIAPDGSSMILPVRSGSSLQLALKLQGSTEITPIVGTEGGRTVVYSPDAQWIAYTVGTDLFKRPLVGGSPVRLAVDADAAANPTLAWLDDGTILYERQVIAGQQRRILQIPEDGGEPLEVFVPEDSAGTPSWVQGLPGGRGALVATCGPAVAACGDNLELYVVDLRDLSSELILEGVLRAWYAPTGHLVYVQLDGALFAAPFDLGALAITGSAIPLFDGVSTTTARAQMHLAADGTLLYVEGPSSGSGQMQLVVVDLEGNEELLVLAPRSIGRVAWSPDGQSVVYQSEFQIYTYNVALGTTPRQLTFEGRNFNPVYSPDGSRVVFSSIREGTEGQDLFVKNLNDDSPPRSVITLPGGQFPYQWLSDTLIVFAWNRGNNLRDLWMVDPSDPDSARAEAYLESEADLLRIAVSPDGTLAAYRSNESGQNEIYVRSFPDPGERTVVSEGGGNTPLWSPDGNTLYYARADGGGTTLMAAQIQRNPVPVVLSTVSLFTVASTFLPTAGSALHPDGDRFIFAQNAGTADAEGGAAEPPRLTLVQNFFEELKERVGG